MGAPRIVLPASLGWKCPGSRDFTTCSDRGSVEDGVIRTAGGNHLQALLSPPLSLAVSGNFLSHKTSSHLGLSHSQLQLLDLASCQVPAGCPSGLETLQAASWYEYSAHHACFPSGRNRCPTSPVVQCLKTVVLFFVSWQDSKFGTLFHLGQEQKFVRDF